MTYTAQHFQDIPKYSPIEKRILAFAEQVPNRPDIMSPEEYNAFVLRMQRNMTYEAIATALGLPKDKARHLCASSLIKALKWLKENTTEAI